MNRKAFFTLTLLVFSFLALGQKKSDLLAEINQLKTERDSLKSLVTTAQKNEKVSTARADSFESQVTELQDANATLMKNLNTFAEISSKNSDNVNKAMASLQDKEKQLKDIRDAISQNDSTSVIVLTNAKQTLGENAKIAVINGEVVISETLPTMFGSDASVNVAASAEAFLGQIASILKANPRMVATVEGLSMTGELDLAANQAASITSVLQKKFGVDPSRMASLGKDGNLKEGVLIRIHAKYDQFYLMVRENMKSNK